MITTNLEMIFDFSPLIGANPHEIVRFGLCVALKKEFTFINFICEIAEGIYCSIGVVGPKRFVELTDFANVILFLFSLFVQT